MNHNFLKRYLCIGFVFISMSVFARTIEANPSLESNAPPLLDQSGSARPSALPEGWGFEIGNGRRIVRNLNGMYGLRINNSWEVGFAGKFTEIFTSLAEGTPRAALRINILDASNCSSCAAIDSFEKLVRLFTNQANGWTTAPKEKFGGLDAIQKEGELTRGRCMLDVRVFKKPGEIATVTLDSAPDCTGQSAYQIIRESLDSFYFVR